MRNKISILFYIILFCISFCIQTKAEKLFDVLVNDGTTPTKSFVLVDTITDKSRIIEVNLKGDVIWAAEFSGPSEETNICRGADIEYIQERDSFRILIPYTSIIEANREGRIMILRKDSGISHDFDTLSNGNILYVRGWANKGDNEFVEISPNGDVIFSWNGSEHISDEQWAQNAKIGNWPTRWNRRLKVTKKGKDWLHINSVEKLNDGSYLISSPNINSILKISKSGDIVEWIGGANIVHDPVQLNGSIIFSEKFPNEEKSDLVERITVLKPSGEKSFLLEGRLRAVRGITVLADGWLNIVSSGQILEINLDGKIRYKAKIAIQNLNDEENLSPYKRQKTLCGSGMGTLYKVAVLQ